jgi:NAD(P)-dependent dehydrogenase (short-subunit alcohol dehydrogenase family)
MICLVTGATRGGGRGIAVGLGEAGATVYCTGRSTRATRSELDRPETIEETAELVTAAGGTGIPVRVDHSDADQVRKLVERIEVEHGRLDVLVNDIWGGEQWFEFDAKLWEHDLSNGLKLVRTLDTHLITSHFALPLVVRSGGLVVEVTDGTADYNATRLRVNAFYDLVKNAIIRLAWVQAVEVGDAATVVALTPGWMRSEEMLEHFKVTEANWRDADVPYFDISETPLYTGRAVAALALDDDRHRWHGQSLSSGGLAQVYGFTDTDGTRPDAWRYIVERREAGHPPDDSGYR